MGFFRVPGQKIAKNGLVESAQEPVDVGEPLATLDEVDLKLQAEQAVAGIHRPRHGRAGAMAGARRAAFQGFSAPSKAGTPTIGGNWITRPRGPPPNESPRAPQPVPSARSETDQRTRSSYGHTLGGGYPAASSTATLIDPARSLRLSGQNRDPRFRASPLPRREAVGRDPTKTLVRPGPRTVLPPVDARL